jgi:tetratricopeptide (TPR) repeat protein
MAVVIVVVLAVGWAALATWRPAALRASIRESARRAEWNQAEDLLSRLAWYRRDDREARNLCIEAALSSGDPAAAARFLGGVPDRAPDVVEARLAQGRLWLQAFRPREAEAAFRGCLRRDPGSDAARLALIAILAIQGRAREYEAEAWALHDRGAEPLKALRLLAQAEPAIPPDTLSRTSDLGSLLRRCLAADPLDPLTRIALARFEREGGRIDEALRLLEPFRGDAWAPSEARLELAACLLDDGEAERLDRFFSDLPGPLEGLSQYWMLRGEWAHLSGRPPEALTCFRTAVRLDPRDPEAHYRLGRALRAAGREHEAAAEMEVARKAQELKDLVSKIPDTTRDADVLAGAGRLCALIGRDREARAWLQLALEVNPGYTEARAALEDLRRPTVNTSNASTR